MLVVGLVQVARRGRRAQVRAENVVVQRQGRSVDPTARSANRRQLARARGWVFGPADRELAVRWSPLPAVRSHIAASRMVTGELDGFPITVIDTWPRPWPSWGTSTMRRAICVVRLPERYPKAHLREFWRDEADQVMASRLRSGPLADLHGEARDARLRRPDRDDLVVENDAQWLVTSSALDVTMAHHLAGWHVRGHELGIVLESTPNSPTNAEVEATLEALVELAKALPPAR